MKKVFLNVTKHSDNLCAIVDDDLYDKINQTNWYAHRVGRRDYAAHSPYPKKRGRTRLYMHRVIMNAGIGDIVDHIDGDGLNNQRHNLRLCTHQQNISHRVNRQRNNTSGHNGVSFDGRAGRWCAYIKKNGKKRHVGSYKTIAEAITARTNAEREMFGDFAPSINSQEKP